MSAENGYGSIRWLGSALGEVLQLTTVGVSRVAVLGGELAIYAALAASRACASSAVTSLPFRPPKSWRSPNISIRIA